MTADFAPKDAETLKSEIIADLGIEYTGNEETIDKLVARELKGEEFKASLHADKKKHLEGKQKKEELLRKAGLNPETGEKLESKDLGGDTTPKNDAPMSLKDIRALQDIHDDDMEEVIAYAKFKGISISEAKKSPIIQTHLRTKEEERQTAAATNISGGRRGTSKLSEEELLEKIATESLSDDEMVAAARAKIQKQAEQYK